MQRFPAQVVPEIVQLSRDCLLARHYPWIQECCGEKGNNDSGREDNLANTDEASWIAAQENEVIHTWQESHRDGKEEVRP
jgi:hypothetical protein